MSATQSEIAIRQAISDGIVRVLAAVGLGGVALVHLLDAPGKFEETPYMGWMYVGLIVSCLALAGTLVRTSDRRVWLAAAVLPATVLLGYTLSRTTGLPQATSDIGNWSEPLGIASLFVEGSLVALSSGVLLSRRSGRESRWAGKRPLGAHRTFEAGRFGRALGWVAQSRRTVQERE